MPSTGATVSTTNALQNCSGSTLGSNSVSTSTGDAEATGMTAEHAHGGATPRPSAPGADTSSITLRVYDKKE